MRRRIECNGGKPRVIPAESDLVLKETGVIYVAQILHGYREGAKPSLYKLHQIGKKWYWIGLWNSIVLYEDTGHSSMNSAITDILIDVKNRSVQSVQVYQLENPAELAEF